MLSDELKSVGAALGRLLGKVDAESAEVLKRCRENLKAATDQAENMEGNFYPCEASNVQN